MNNYAPYYHKCLYFSVRAPYSKLVSQIKTTASKNLNLRYNLTGVRIRPLSATCLSDWAFELSVGTAIACVATGGTASGVAVMTSTGIWEGLKAAGGETE